MSKRDFITTLHPKALQAGAIVLLCCAGMIGCERAKGQQVQLPPRPPAQVTVAASVTRDVPVFLDEIGKTVAVDTVTIMSQVAGKVISVHVGDGAYINKGDLLFEIDPRPFEATLASARATLAQNKAELQLAKVEFGRVQEMVSTGSASLLEFEQKKSAVAVGEAKIAAAEAAIETAKLNVEYTKIFAPIDGRGGARLVDPGNIVKANEAPLLVIQRLEPIYAEFTVNENDLGTVRKYMAARGLDLSAPEQGLRVEVDMPGDSARILSALGTPAPATGPVRSYAGPREGKLTFLDNAVQTGSGTVRLRATLPNADRYFWPGQFVNVRLVLSMKKDAVLIPVKAQQIGQQGAFVYVVTPESIAEMRPIIPGQRHGDLLVVEKGVQPGERVVVSGQMAIAPNGKVQVTGETPATGQPVAIGSSDRAQ